MSRLLVVLVVLSQALFAYEDKDVMLNIHAKIIPRIVLMSKVRQVDHNGTITIVLLYEKRARNDAESLKKKILQNYPNGLSKRQLKIQLRYIDTFTATAAPSGSLLFVCDIDEHKIASLVNMVTDKGLITMSLRESAIDLGVMVSLHVGRYVKPIINPKAAKKAGITFSNNLIRISKIYHKDTP